eukprot:TRINITY_DN1077_c0_g1_i1.p1 TRINITY_DN1077_c0_g1~~TRINITY_DN1077_c0_g1_i1.p1  ORF type:complete len:287 (+),score=42.54 TRINITY_DN1077_c0_g1_i1:257-1117(+)
MVSKQGDIVLDIDGQGGQAGKDEQIGLSGADLERKARGAGQAVVQIVPIAFSVICGVVALCAWIFHFVGIAGLSAYLWCVILGVAVVLGIGTGVGMTFYYGSMSKQLKRFKAENDRLEDTASKLGEQVNDVKKENDKLEKSVDSLGETATKLKQTSDKLQQQLGQFDGLQKSMQEASEKLGLNVADLVGETASMFKEISALNLRNERILLRRIAEDIEFMDRDVGMSKMEFERFIVRVPEKYHSFLKSVKFEDYAGEDQVLDMSEIRKILDDMMAHLEKQSSDLEK